MKRVTVMLAVVLVAVACTVPPPNPPGPSSYLLYPTQNPVTGEWVAFFAACQSVSGTIAVETVGTPGSPLLVTIKEAPSSAVLASGHLVDDGDVVAASTVDLVCFSVDVVRDPPSPAPPGPFSVLVKWNQ